MYRIKRAQVLIAEDENKIIAFLFGFVYQIPEMFIHPVAILNPLYVKEDYRHM